jgi:hypothetical protein
MDYIVKAFEKRPSSERRDFIESVQDLLRDLESRLEPKHEAPTVGCS